jgi:hypothetical protein
MALREIDDLSCGAHGGDTPDLGYRHDHHE